MIEYKTGDILQEDADALVNTVNCVGIMGRGVALQFKNAYPANFRAYAAACSQNLVQPGEMFIYKNDELTGPKYIVNFPTKRHWRGKSKIEDIESGLADLVAQIQSRKIASIAIPPLGAGLGGLPWSEVRERIEQALKPLDDVRIVVFEPGQAPDPSVMARAIEVPAMTAGRAALIMLMDRYVNALLDPFVTLLEVHKLMYFMQEAGEPLRLRYKKHNYGPYAENLRHVLKSIEGHLVVGYADGGDQPTKPLELLPGAINDAYHFTSSNADVLSRIDRTAELIRGFQSPIGLELLATVHWVVVNEHALSPEEATKAVHDWNPRKRKFTGRQVAIAYRTLEEHGWMAA